MIPDDLEENVVEGLETLRIGVTLDLDEEAIEVGPRVVHEVDARTLFRHVERELYDLPEHEADFLDVPPRFELTLWDETEIARWPLAVVAIPRELAVLLLDGEDEFRGHVFAAIPLERLAALETM